VVLLGGTGLLGSYFIREHVTKLDKIVALDVRPSTKLISDVIKDYGDRIEIVRGDVSELADIMEAIKMCPERPSAVYPLAALLSGEAEASPNRAFRVNVEGLHNSLEACRILGVKKVVFPSSIAVYGSGVPRVVGEDVALRPETFYGASKVFGELWGLRYSARYGIDFKVLRFPSIIGPGRVDGGITIYASMSIQKAAQGEAYTIRVSPSSRVPIMYVKDAVKALLDVKDAETPSRVYNVAGIRPTPTAGDIVNAIKRLIPDARISFNPNPEYDRVVSSWPEDVDDTRARREWGWRPAYPDLNAVVEDFIGEVRRRGDIFRV